MKNTIILDSPMDHCASQHYFKLKFLQTAKPMCSSYVGLKQGLMEMLQACANSLCEKIGEKGVHVIKELISENVIELCTEIVTKHKFDDGLKMLKMLKKINGGRKFALMNEEEGMKFLQNTTDATSEHDANMTENANANIINDNCMHYVETNENINYADSDSSCGREDEARVEK